MQMRLLELVYASRQKGIFMAKKRLNKKVALIGSGIFVLLILLAIGVILHLSRDPETFIKDGDAAIKTAREITDEKLMQQ
jgi:hypothetical protein